jgi:hypothetical protein
MSRIEVGTLVLHKISGAISRVKELHEPGSYLIAGKPVSHAVAVFDNGEVCLLVPGSMSFYVLPNAVEGKIDFLRTLFDMRIADAARVLRETNEIDENVAMLIVGAVIRERLRKET